MGRRHPAHRLQLAVLADCSVNPVLLPQLIVIQPGILKLSRGLGPEKLKDLLKVWGVDCNSLANETSAIKDELN